MFCQILYTQWKWSRLVLLLCFAAGFAAPLLSVQAVGDPHLQGWDVQQMLAEVEKWGYAYPLLATVVALLLSLTTWGPDHAGRHVYALSLPLPRWRYALLRFSAGLVLLATVVFGVWLGALIATSAASPPPGIHAYPTAIALRFALAGFVAYSFFFAISAGTNRTAGIVLVIIGGLVLAQLLAFAIGLDFSLGDVAAGFLFIWPGPLEIFSGRWMLFDV